MIWDNDRWHYFKPDELLSPDGLKAMERFAFVLQPSAIDTLCALRDKLGKPVIVNFNAARCRGYRSHEENNAAGGKEYSFHVQGCAFDCSVSGMELHELAEAGRFAGFTNAIIYDKHGFVHFDSRYLGKNGVGRILHAPPI